jgi:hypothetical protein
MQLMRNVLFIGGMAGLLFLLVACSPKEGKKPVETTSHEESTKTQTTVVEPEFVKGKWLAVKLGVTDKQSGRESTYDIPLRIQTPIPNSDISITVDNFLPHFIMQGRILTSQSNEPKNPAARIRVYEKGKEIFKGWLFSLYPTTHTFQHPRYGFTLKGFIPAK